MGNQSFVAHTHTHTHTPQKKRVLLAHETTSCMLREDNAHAQRRDEWPLFRHKRERERERERIEREREREN